MAAPTVYKDVADDFKSGGQLFAGKKFFVLQRVPSRKRFLDDIKGNGGEIVLLEKNADYMIADHTLGNCPPGTISYEFIDKSIREGELQDPEDHLAGPRVGEPREAGATNRPTKGTRKAYTAEEDRILYKWVRDAESSGGLSSGNDIYKQLEAKHPQHTWQSWRDRYLKRLQHRPPSTFNIPDNAPPSPPSDRSNEPSAPDPASSRPAKQPTPTLGATSDANELSRKRKAVTENNYSVDDLAAMFTSDDWDELYAFVDIISGCEGQENYNVAWALFAEGQGNQTADQWRQYYEKVVRPQWESDPIWKREQIKEKMVRKHDEDKSSQVRSPSQDQRPELQVADSETSAQAPAAQQTTETKTISKPSAPEDERFENLLEKKRGDQTDKAYTFYAREKKSETWNAQPGLDYAELYSFLKNKWDTLSEEDKAPYFAMDAAITKRTLEEVAKLSSDVKQLSSSTARPESPKFGKMYDNAMKRLHEIGTVEEQEEEAEISRPIKRRKMASATPVQEDDIDEPGAAGTHNQPLEISSAASSTSTESEAAEEALQEQARAELFGTLDDEETMVEHDEEEAEKPAESIESDDFPDIDNVPPPPAGYETVLDEDDLPLDSPTPRATRHKISNFNTQAILSSPTQDKPTRLNGFNVDDNPPSDASTTQSLQEFRRSLNSSDLAHLPYTQTTRQQPSPSPAPSTTSTTSTSSGDPDPPLSASEIDAFFIEQRDQGFSDEFIVAALRRTRLRPELAVRVLDAWQEGKQLPYERGVWSREDDETVESGDGVELARLERKHTLDGWGGITERLVFLEAERR